MSSNKKVVLAYSGGLDTSIIIRWMMERGYEVVALYADVGQGEDTEKIRRKALATGASKIYIEDLRQEYAQDFCLKALQAGAIYEGHYYMSASLSRPLIAKHLVRVAGIEQAQAVAHGSTGKGNDQVRFEVSVMALAPELEIWAPVRTWEFHSREEEIEYAHKHNIPVEASKAKPYSLDQNLWGVCIECGVLENPWAEPPADIYQWTALADNSPEQPAYVELEFEQGVPVKLNGQARNPVEMLQELNVLGGKYGIGRSDMVESRLVGIKSREVYEAPAAHILHTALADLKTLVLDRDTIHFTYGLSQKYAELTYNGLWFSPLRQALDGFFGTILPRLTGNIRLKLYKGNCTVVGRQSPHSLYNLKLATYDAQDAFNHKDGEGFCKIWGLPLKVQALQKK